MVYSFLSVPPSQVSFRAMSYFKNPDAAECCRTGSTPPRHAKKGDDIHFDLCAMPGSCTRAVVGVHVFPEVQLSYHLATAHHPTGCKDVNKR